MAAYLQNKAPAKRRGRFIAASNFLAFSAMLLAPVLFWVLTGPVGATPSQIFIVGGLISLALGIWAIGFYCKHQKGAG